MIKAMMHGCNGRMGHDYDLVKEDEQITIAAGVDTFTGTGIRIRYLGQRKL